MATFKDQLADIIALESGLDPDGIGQAQGLMSTGIMDSFALVAVISLVEAKVGHEIDPADLTFENFDSLDSICAFVERAHVG
jgi:acyl carrier protein